MDIKDLYNDPIITKMRKGNFEDPYLDYNESLQIINSERPLTELPAREYRVQVSQNGSYLKEIEDGSPTENQFKVDYTQGIVHFHSSRSGQTFLFTYKGKGMPYIPASRLWTKDHGNGVVETLEDLVDTSNEKLTEVTQKIAEAETATIETKNATADFNTAIEQSMKIYKPMVETFANIATTYPTPEIGWTVGVRDVQLEYRWDGVEWIVAGFLIEGMYVYKSSTPPANKNMIWLKVEQGDGVPRGLKILPSSTEPTDKNVVWWKLD